MASSGTTGGTAPSGTTTAAPTKETVVQLTEQMFHDVNSYLQAELQVTKEDYRMIETMNNLTKQKYSDLAYLAENANTLNASLMQKYEAFKPYLEQIDQLDESITVLEQATREIDDYSKRLEAKFRKLQAK